MNEIVKKSVVMRDGFTITYFEQPCTRGCDVVIAGKTEDQVRAFMKGHRNLSSCIERSHRRTQLATHDTGRARPTVKRGAVAAVVAAPPPAPSKSRKKPSKPAIGWNGEVLG